MAVVGGGRIGFPRPCVGPGPPVDVLLLIDKLDDFVHSAKRVRLRGQVRVHREEVYDILDQMRATISDDVKQARWIVKERQELLAAAKREAQRVVAGARERQTELVRQHELARRAKLEAEGWMVRGRASARSAWALRTIADEILSSLEVNLSRFIAAIRRDREYLNGADEPADVG